ncbi:Holliday junction branch migration protein RuvA [Siphonobacter aquaeclarae]|uniref:Holliday junction branch migration complex subunit RuvA n=1 Tax=Siphonobacter aquaeclarae TaxID=563176 RepID=A0A1G9NA65_9BACT|nr:Holliday junction branch migration protein RuvA [Siphonobacter aquaeclarae]SDL83349.1 Holliday junction DNA helicase subunit RuvA [Siphonobacter aquaeclarae]
MIAYLDGKLTYKEPAYAIVDVQGVGYEVRISLQTFSALPAIPEKCRLFTYLAIREDAHVLFGFAEPGEKQLFLDLVSVSGIGPNTALVMLSSLSAAEIKQAIAAEDLRVIQGIKGIGAKTAQRVILELKDKMRKESLTGGTTQTSLLTGGSSAVRNDAISALVVMGIPRPAAEKSVETILKKQPDVTVEELIKLSLR